MLGLICFFIEEHLWVLGVERCFIKECQNVSNHFYDIFVMRVRTADDPPSHEATARQARMASHVECVAAPVSATFTLTRLPGRSATNTGAHALAQRTASQRGFAVTRDLESREPRI